MESNDSSRTVCVVGLGYVGLPLAVAFGKTDLKVFGFDVNAKKIGELKEGHDSMGEVTDEELAATSITYSDSPDVIAKSDFIIAAVPTPIDKAKKPDLKYVRSAAQVIGENLKNGSIVVFESTVYPGVTEEICQPIIEEVSGLKCGVDWKIGYSPERINPGDKEHTIDKIVKVISGMDEESLETIAEVYKIVCKAGVYKAASIKTAEAAKVIENIQRDLNIGLINELSLIFERLGLNTKEVLEAAGTKWNFHRYQPGLVGGHCIGVDPYYLTYRAEELGYHPQIILAGRRINDSMPDYVAELMLKGLIEAGKTIRGSKVLVLGLTFKENVNDIRNSKIKKVIEKLREYQIEVIAHDPLLSEVGALESFGVKHYTSLEGVPTVDGIVFGVLHKPFESLTLNQLKSKMSEPGVLVDVKSRFSSERLKAPLIYKCL